MSRETSNLIPSFFFSWGNASLQIVASLASMAYFRSDSWNQFTPTATWTWRRRGNADGWDRTLSNSDHREVSVLHVECIVDVIEKMRFSNTFLPENFSSSEMRLRYGSSSTSHSSMMSSILLRLFRELSGIYLARFSLKSRWGSDPVWCSVLPVLFRCDSIMTLTLQRQGLQSLRLLN